MIVDPFSAVVVVGALGVSGMLRSRDEQIFEAIEKRLALSQPEHHRIVIDYKPDQVVASSMKLNSDQ